MRALRSSPGFKVVVTILLVLFVALIVPKQLGGEAIFVVVNGNSMEPVYYRGDLVVVRTAARYEVGDIVTFQHPEIGPVIHRVIGRDGRRWVFQGDNNNFIDPYRPTTAELLGKALFHVPKLGTAMIFLNQSPFFMSILLGGGTLAMSVVTSQPKRRGGDGKPRKGSRSSAVSTGADSALSFLTLVGIAAIALAGFAFSRPTLTTIEEELAYTQSGAFGYSAAAPPGIYDAPAAQSGEPIFRALSTSLALSFGYRLDTELPVALAGRYSMLAEVRTQNGWKRTIELLAEQPFQGRSFEAAAVLDLVAIQGLIERLEAETGLQHQQFTLAILPEVAVEGTLAGELLQESFAPELLFTLDKHQLSLVHSDENDPLAPSQTDALVREREAPNMIELLGQKLPVAAARTLALVAVGLAAASGLALGIPLLRATRSDEDARIRLRYGTLIIDGSTPAEQSATQTVAVASIADLARLAERHGAMIVREQTGTALRYVVYDSRVAYVFVPGQQRTPQPQPVPAAAAHSTAPGTTPVALETWHHTFVETLRASGNASAACQAVGISLAKAYNERAANPAFAAAWDAAREAARRQLP